MFITSLVILFALMLPFRSTRENGFYILHMIIVLSITYYTEHNLFRTPVFHKYSFMCFLILHIISINIVTMLAYAKDKKAAMKKEWRIPERNLHALEILGGTPLAMISQKIFRHKTKKSSYKSFFIFIFIMQISIILFIAKEFIL